MLIMGCDFHTRYEQIAMAREQTDGLPRRLGGCPTRRFYVPGF